MLPIFPPLYGNEGSKIGLTQPPLLAGFETPTAVRHTSVIIEKCVSPEQFANFLLPFHRNYVLVVIFYKIIKDEESTNEFPYSTRCHLG